MAFEDILGDEYMCEHCKLVYRVYGSRKRCDRCNRRLKKELEQVKEAEA